MFHLTEFLARTIRGLQPFVVVVDAPDGSLAAVWRYLRMCISETGMASDHFKGLYIGYKERKRHTSDWYVFSRKMGRVGNPGSTKYRESSTIKYRECSQAHFQALQ